MSYFERCKATLSWAGFRVKMINRLSYSVWSNKTFRNLWAGSGAHYNHVGEASVGEH